MVANRTRFPQRTGRTRLERRAGGALMIVLFIMVTVALLTAQGVRLMMLTHRAFDQRIHAAQANELLDLARLRLADQNREESLSVEVPAAVGEPSVGNIEIQHKSNTGEGWRIIVRFPHHQPNELTVTWESPS